MRQTIKTVFPDRDVAVMVRPALQESDLQQLDKLAYSNLRPEFRRVSALAGRLAGRGMQCLKAVVRRCFRRQNGGQHMHTLCSKAQPLVWLPTLTTSPYPHPTRVCDHQDMEAFMAVLKGKTRPMAVGGTLISGPLMAGLAEAYVEAVNKGGSFVVCVLCCCAS